MVIYVIFQKLVWFWFCVFVIQDGLILNNLNWYLASTNKLHIVQSNAQNELIDADNCGLNANTALTS